MAFTDIPVVRDGRQSGLRTPVPPLKLRPYGGIEMNVLCDVCLFYFLFCFMFVCLHCATCRGE